MKLDFWNDATEKDAVPQLREFARQLLFREQIAEFETVQNDALRAAQQIKKGVTFPAQIWTARLTNAVLELAGKGLINFAMRYELVVRFVLAQTLKLSADDLKRTTIAIREALERYNTTGVLS